LTTPESLRHFGRSWWQRKEHDEVAGAYWLSLNKGIL
jgi:hypothetical protein